MKKLLRICWSCLEVIIIIYVIFMTTFILCKNKYGYTQFGDYTFHNATILDERNIQNTKKGELLVFKSGKDIKKGDIIYYYSVYNENYVIKSRLVLDITNDDYSSLYTVDDGNPTTVASTRVIGNEISTYPRLGSITSVLESRVGFLFLVLLPIMIVFIYQVYEFVMIIHYEKVEEDKNDKKEKSEDVEIL